jgi:hypothetical protein
MKLSGAGGAGSVVASDPQSVIMATRQLAQTKQEGRDAVALIQSAEAPPSDGVRGTRVNVMG